MSPSPHRIPREGGDRSVLGLGGGINGGPGDGCLSQREGGGCHAALGEGWVGAGPLYPLAPHRRHGSPGFGEDRGGGRGKRLRECTLQGGGGSGCDWVR